MNTTENSFFSWTARRFLLPTHTDDAGAGGHFDLDRPLTVGRRRAQLVSFDDGEDDYTVLLVGDPTGVREVPIRIVESEMLLTSGARSQRPVEILIAAPASACVEMHHEMVRQLCHGGPLRNLAIAVGVQSVVVDWFDAIGQAA